MHEAGNSDVAIELGRVLDAVPLLVASVDRRGHYRYVNHAYAARLGLTPADIVGRRLVDVIGEAACAAIQPFIERALVGERVQSEVSITYPGAGPQIMRLTMTPAIDSTGAVTGWDGVGENVTDARAAEAANRELAFLIHQARDFISVSDLDLRARFVNEAGRQLCGLTGSVSGISIFDLVAAQHHEYLRQEFFPAVLERGHASADVQFIHQQTGVRFWMQCNVFRLEGSDGGVTGFATISRDLSDQHRTDRLLRESAAGREEALARFRELADSMPQIVWSVDETGSHDYFNRQWYTRTGTSRPLEINPIDMVHPEDKSRALDHWRDVSAEGGTFELEYRMRFPGEPDYRWYLGRTVPARDGAGQIVRWYGTATDVNDLKRVERALATHQERLRAALDASETGTFHWDLRTDAVTWDETVDRLFGLRPGRSIGSLSEFVALVHPDDRDAVVAACRRSQEHGADFEQEFRVVQPDGSLRWIYDKGRCYRDADGRPAYMTGACVDVTERRQKENALREADRQKDEFLGMLAHELRNPLTPLLYAVANMATRTVDASAQKSLDVMTRQIGRLTRLVDDLLDVSRVSQGKITFSRTLLDLAEVLRHAIEAVRPVLDRHQHTLTADLASGIIVRGDLERLGQIFENLLNNAIKYTPAPGQLGIRLAVEGRHAVVVVSDNGIGIPATLLPRVFDLFVQADDSSDRAQGGLGIGLTLVDRLVRLHGGTVTAASDGPGRGAQFVVRLPLADLSAMELS